MRHFFRKPTVPAGVSEEALRAALIAHKEGQPKFTRRMAISIADHFGITPWDVIRYGERTGLLKRGTADWFHANGGFSKDNFAEARADRAPAST